MFCAASGSSTGHPRSTPSSSTGIYLFGVERYRILRETRRLRAEMARSPSCRTSPELVVTSPQRAYSWDIAMLLADLEVIRSHSLNNEVAMIPLVETELSYYDSRIPGGTTERTIKTLTDRRATYSEPRARHEPLRMKNLGIGSPSRR